MLYSKKTTLHPYNPKYHQTQEEPKSSVLQVHGTYTTYIHQINHA